MLGSIQYEGVCRGLFVVEGVCWGVRNLRKYADEYLREYAGEYTI